MSVVPKQGNSIPSMHTMVRNFEHREGGGLRNMRNDDGGAHKTPGAKTSRRSLRA